MFAIPPSSRKAEIIDLVLNSKYRDNYTTSNSNDYRVTLSEPIPGQITRYGLKTCMIPKTGFNISGSFEITDSTGVKVVTPTPGNYTALSLATELETVLNGLAVDTYTVTLVGARYTITSTFATFIINPNSLVSRTLYSIGFAGNIPYTAVAGSLTSPYNINLADPEYLYVTVAPLKKHIKNITGATHNFIINYGCNYGSIVYHDSQNKYVQEYPPYNFVSELNLNKFRVSLRYEDGSLYDLQGSDWSITINLEVVKNYSYQGQ